MSLNFVNITPVLHVKDLAASRTFYTKLGLHIRSGSASHSLLSLSLVPGSPELLLQQVDASSSSASFTEHTFRIRLDGDHGIEQIRAKLVDLFPSEMQLRGWGEQHFVLKDPDGHRVEVSQAKPIYQG